MSKIPNPLFKIFFKNVIYMVAIHDGIIAFSTLYYAKLAISDESNTHLTYKSILEKIRVKDLAALLNM